MSSAASTSVFPTCSGRSIGCIWRRGTPCASAWNILLQTYFGSVSRPLSPFAEIEHGHCGKNDSRLKEFPVLVWPVSQGRTRAVPWPNGLGRTYGSRGNDCYGHFHDFPSFLCVPGRDFCALHLARECASHYSVVGHHARLHGPWRGVHSGLRVVCYQLPHGSFVVGDGFIFPRLLRA